MVLFNRLTKVTIGVAAFGCTAVYTKDYLAGPDFDAPVELKGKVAIVTGANSGVGYEVAKGLAARGAKVYLACRDKDRCAEARENIFLATENKNIHCRYCDLASLDSVKRFVRRLQKDEEKVDILVNNAGIMWGPREVTEEGFEKQLGVNHLGHFFLTNLLVDRLKAGVPSRIINVASTAHLKGTINVQDLNSADKYTEGGAYQQSKLANVLFTRELARRLEGTGVTTNAVHPGIVDTNIVRHSGSITKFLMVVLKPFVWPFVKSPHQGAQAVLHVALHPDLQDTTGQYFSLREVAEPNKEALNDQLALWLWLTSEKWTKLDDARKELGVEPLSIPVHRVSSVAVSDMKQKATVVKGITQEVAGNSTVNVLAS